MSEKKTACCVGLGPAGLVAVKELKQTGFFDGTAYDALSEIGGRWAMDPSYESSGVWKELCFNGTRRSCGLSDFDWKREDYMDENKKDLHGIFPHNSEAKAYLHAYAKQNDLLSCCQLNTKVVSTEFLDDGRWKVTTTCSNTEGEAQETESRVFDFLVVCPGRQAEGRNQLKDKELKAFSGKVLHSVEMKSIHDFQGQRVLVVGASVSGTDISSELARKGECIKVASAVRSVPYHVDRVSPVTGISIDDIMWQRLPVWLGRFLPDSIVFQGLKATVQSNFPLQLTEEMTGSAALVPDADILKAGVGFSSGYVPCVRDKKLTLKPAVQSSSGKKITFADGSTDEFDVIICATGYDTNLSFLSKDVLETIQYTSPYTGAKETALYKYTLVPNVENLALVGMFNGIGPIFMAFEMQARYIAAIWSGKLSRPSVAAVQAGVDEFKSYRLRGRHNSNELCTKITEDLADELNLTPSIPEALWNARRLLVGPLYSFYFRTKKEIEGDKVATVAKELFDYYTSHPDKAEDFDL